MSLTIHQSGIDAATNTQATGFAAVTLANVDLYRSADEKIKTLPLSGVQVIEPSRIYVVAQDSSIDSYDVQQLRFFTSTGELFATAQNDDGSTIQSKAPNTTLVLAHQLSIATAPGSVAPSGDVSVMPPATESLIGGAEIATQPEVNSGTDDSRFVTPKKLLPWLQSLLGSNVDSTSTTTPASLAAVKTAYDKAVQALGDGTRKATESQRGQAEVATQAEVEKGTDNTRFVTPQKLVPWLQSLLSSKVDSTSTTTPASLKAVKTAYDKAVQALGDGTRQASESQKGQAEVATQAEVDKGTDDSRFVTPKKLKKARGGVAWNDITGKPSFGSAASHNTGQKNGNVPVIGNPSMSGYASLIVDAGTNANGTWLLYSSGLLIQYGQGVVTNGGYLTLPKAYSHNYYPVLPSHSGAAAGIIIATNRENYRFQVLHQTGAINICWIAIGMS